MPFSRQLILGLALSSLVGAAAAQSQSGPQPSPAPQAAPQSGPQAAPQTGPQPPAEEDDSDSRAAALPQTGQAQVPVTAVKKVARTNTASIVLGTIGVLGVVGAASGGGGSDTPPPPPPKPSSP